MQKRTQFQRLLIMLNTLFVMLIVSVGLDILATQATLSTPEVTTTVQERVERVEIAKEAPIPTPIVPLEERVVPTNPNRIEIPSLQLSAEVVSVGVTPDNVMEVPEDGSKVGWYSLGVKPGEKGGSIMTAHYDTSTGKPAVFYTLRRVQQGDPIFIQTEDGEELLFRVEDIVSLPVNGFPTELIYGDFPGKELILITCDGIWNPVERNYSKRLVVFATLWENKTL